MIKAWAATERLRGEWVYVGEYDSHMNVGQDTHIVISPDGRAWWLSDYVTLAADPPPPGSHVLQRLSYWGAGRALRESRGVRTEKKGGA